MAVGHLSRNTLPQCACTCWQKPIQKTHSHTGPCLQASGSTWTSKAKILLLAVVLSCAVCENWASREPSLSPVTSLQDFDCDENYNLCIVQRTGACHFLQDTYQGLDVVGQPDATQFQVSAGTDGSTVPLVCCTVYSSICSDLLGSSAAPAVAASLTDLSTSSTCGDWAAYLVSRGDADNLAMNCDEGNCLARSMAWEYAEHVADAPQFVNLTWSDYGAYQAAQKLGVVPTIIDFTNVPSSVVPKWPAALC